MRAMAFFVALLGAVSLVIYSCQTPSGSSTKAGEPPAPDKTATAAAPPAPAAVSAETAAALSLGTIMVLDRDTPYLLVAPHGSFDPGTDKAAAAFCSRVAWDCVIADGYRTQAHPINVNRPSEGAQLSAKNEPRTPRATAVYDYFRGRVNAIRRKQVLLYVELHDNRRPKTAGHLEIATTGIDAARAARIKTAFQEALRDAGVKGIDTVLIEPVDAGKLTMTASANKQFGMIAELGAPTLHLEFATPAVEQDPERIATVLAKTLPKIAAAEFPAPH